MGTDLLQLNRDLRAKQKKNTERFEAIWKSYYPRLVVFVQGMVNQPNVEVQDIVQEILVKIFQNLHRYNPRYTLNTWIYGIARNHCLDFLRKESTYRRTVQALLQQNAVVEAGISLQGAPEERFLHAEVMDSIEHFLHTLGREEQQIAMLRFYESMKYREIGLVLNMPTGTVKYKVHTIRSQLKDFLEKTNER